MASFPNFSNIQDFVKSTLNKRVGNPQLISKLNPFVRLVSGGGAGLVLDSNPNNNLFRAAGRTYGSSTQAGRIGTTWGGADVNPSVGQGYRPSPIVTSLEVDEGAGNLSRKANFSITCFTKEQMEILTRYFLEPGMSVFLEWGWNTSSGVSGLTPLKASAISKYQNASNRDAVRKDTAGEYDNYLGFTTGGGVSLDGDKWTINVNCTGYTELPTYLLSSETGDQKLNEEKKIPSAKVFGLNYINTADSTLGDERFMKMFNDLPQTRQTVAVKGLRGKFAADDTKLINFDDEVIEEINDSSDGFKLPLVGWEVKSGKVTIDGKAVKFPAGTKITADERFIRFDAMMDIIYEIGVSGYELPDGTEVTFEIDYKDTACTAFEKIYSTEPDKLFIPNPQSPKFNLSAITSDSSDLPTVSQIRDAGTVNNSPLDRIKFPNPNDYTSPDKKIFKSSNEWGYLKDLYVNFDFFKGVLDTKQFYIKDALYQILNGMSSAVNGMWDFQIKESDVTVNDKSVSKLKIVEMNLITNGKQTPTHTFEMIGADSVFIDASLDLDISGNKMNQVIGSKLGADLNSDSKKISLFTQDEALTDQLAVKLKRKETNKKDDDNTTEEDKADIAEANLAIMMGKARFYPKVEISDKTSVDGVDLYDLCYLGAYKDSTIFSALKSGHDEETSSASPLMPINFSFKVHGVSGIRRGDMFKVNGIPSIYNNGFFQVLSVKHTLDGMMWTTEVTGGYRNNK